MRKSKSPDVEDILREHQLKATPQRIQVLEVFLSRNSVLGLPDLMNHLGKSFDRITLYRTLNSFEENGLIHRIPDKTGNATYALCSHDSVDHSHDDNHVHFKCEKCLNTFCLEEVVIPPIQLNKKFKPLKYNFLIEGLCEMCNKK